MTVDERLIEKIKRLPMRQQSLLESLVDELARTGDEERGIQSQEWYGSLQQLGIDITEEEIDEARKEMWSGGSRSS